VTKQWLIISYWI